MAVLYAICPFCLRTIGVNSDLQAGYKCSACESDLTIEILKEKNAFIDLEESNKEFQEAKLYFDNTDFRAAFEHFEKSIKANPNNYLSNYFFGLCQVYENEDKPEFNIPKSLIKTFIDSIHKMDYSFVEMKHRIAFIAASLNELYIVLLGHFKKLTEKYDTIENRKFFREKILSFLSAINDLHAIGKEKLMSYDPSVSSSLVGVTDLAITACHAVAMPHLDHKDRADALSDMDFNTVSNYYNSFVVYATSLDKKFNLKKHTIDYNENQLFNKDTLLLINNYYTLNKDNNRKHLSLTGELLDNMNRKCFYAAKLTFNTCVRNIGINKNDPTRIGLINQAVNICLERLLPRLFIDNSRRVNVIALKKLDEICEITDMLDEMVNSLPSSARRTTHDLLDDYYSDLSKIFTIYYYAVSKSYSKIVNKLKKARNDEYRYYRDFLYDSTLACSTALLSVLNSSCKKKKKRLRVVAFCKEISEEFLLLCDYRIAAIEASPKFADIIKIYGRLDSDIVALKKM